MTADKKRILIVDDSQSTLDILSASLEDAGFEVRSERNPLMVLSTMRQWQPHVVLVDVGMPLVSGERLVGDIRSYHSGLVKVVLHSSRTVEELNTMVKRCGADGAIAKNTGVLATQLAPFL